MCWNPKNYINAKILKDLIDLYDGEVNYVDVILVKLLKFFKKKFFYSLYNKGTNYLIPSL